MQHLCVWTALNLDSTTQSVPAKMASSACYLHIRSRFSFVQSGRPKRTGSGQFEWKCPRRAQTSVDVLPEISPHSWKPRQCGSQITSVDWNNCDTWNYQRCCIRTFFKILVTRLPPPANTSRLKWKNNMELFKMDRPTTSYHRWLLEVLICMGNYIDGIMATRYRGDRNTRVY